MDVEACPARGVLRRGMQFPSQPPPTVIQQAISASLQSPCRSKRGAAIWRERYRLAIAIGWNDLPLGACDGSDACKETCGRVAIHAEQRALLSASAIFSDCAMLHVRTIDGALVPSGEPSCIECAKLIVASGIGAMYLYHADGWRLYDVADFYYRSLAHHEITKTADNEVNVIVTDGVTS